MSLRSMFSDFFVLVVLFLCESESVMWTILFVECNVPHDYTIKIVWNQYKIIQIQTKTRQNLKPVYTFGHQYTRSARTSSSSNYRPDLQNYPALALP